MDGQSIRYGTSRDGVRIAYTALGSGPPVVFLDSYIAAGVDLRPNSPRSGDFCRALSESRKVILIDGRGSGLSGPADDFSLQRFIDDVECVVNHAGADSFALCSYTAPNHIAIEFAAVHPRRIRKLVLIRPRPSGESARTAPATGLIAHLISSDWEVFTEVHALRNLGWNARGEEYVRQLRRHWTPAKFLAFCGAVEAFDAFPRAREVASKALIVATNGVPERYQASARELASLLANSQLIFRDQNTPLDEQLARIVDEFLGETDLPTREEDRSAPIAFRTILFTDLESHTQMMQRLGDTKGREDLREHERITREALAAHGGSEVKTMGDGFMASFSSAQKAVECAVALQTAFGGMEGEPVKVRVGINAGEPIAEDDDLFGSSVILAARTAAKATGGEILVTDVVRLLVAGKGFVFADRGETEMRGFEEPVRLHEVRWN